MLLLPAKPRLVQPSRIGTAARLHSALLSSPSGSPFAGTTRAIPFDANWKGEIDLPPLHGIDAGGILVKIFPPL